MTIHNNCFPCQHHGLPPLSAPPPTSWLASDWVFYAAIGIASFSIGYLIMNRLLAEPER
jgi:hypothetical protein